MHVHMHVIKFLFLFSLPCPQLHDYYVDQICGHMLHVAQGLTYFLLFVVHIHHNHDGFSVMMCAEFALSGTQF